MKNTPPIPRSWVPLTALVAVVRSSAMAWVMACAMSWTITWTMTTPALAETVNEKPLSPYIDQLKREIEAPKAPGASSAGYSQKLQNQLKARPAKDSSENYSRNLKKQLDEAENPTVAPSYTETVRRGLEPKTEGGAIQAVQENRSDLHPKFKGEVHHAAGFRYGASLTRAFSAESQLRDFDSIYGVNYAPDVTLFYEYQPFHSETYGNIGIMVSAGVGYYHGTGVFQFQLNKPSQMGGGQFPSTSVTQFQFFSLPLMAGINYRFNLLRYLRPFVMAGPALMSYLELRNDDGPTHYGESRGLFLSGGVSILLDWISRGSSWDLYAEHKIKHYYLTVDYSRLSSFSGDLSSTVSGVNAGLTFEF